MAKNTKQINGESICLNDQTVGNFKKYLAMFPDDARIVIHSTDHEDYYHNYDCQIGCNFDHQKETNTVMVFQGFVVE